MSAPKICGGAYDCKQGTNEEDPTGFHG